MKTFNILGYNLYLYEKTQNFSLSNNEFDKETSLVITDDLLKSIDIKCYTFCINLSNNCNLNCKYCFNNEKNKKSFTTKEMINKLDNLIETFNDGEKYIIDLSGKGEPILNLKQILDLSKWRVNKQNEIKKEIIIMFVSNGTLLTKEITKSLKENEILYGVSIDGTKEIHDKYRIDKKGKPTFDTIIDNISKIDNLKYVGCAATLTDEVFSLNDSIDYLSKYFETISYRPVRGNQFLSEEAVDKWIIEYDKLATRLINDIYLNDLRIFYCLMNGDDYFGRYLNKAFGNQITINRCDSSIVRFTIDVDGKIYGCPASSMYDKLSINKLSKETSFIELKKQAYTCTECEFKYYCGGECAIELLENNGLVKKHICKFKKHLILLANLIKCIANKINPSLSYELEQFSNDKLKRNRKNEKLYLFLKENPNLSFSEGKSLFDKISSK